MAMAMPEVDVVMGSENMPANVMEVSPHGLKRGAPDLETAKRQATQFAAPAALYPRPIDASDHNSHHRRMSALFHDMEAQLAGEPLAPEPEEAAAPLDEAAQEAAAEAAQEQATEAWHKWNQAPEPEAAAEWWTLASPARQRHREQQAAWSTRGDEVLAALEAKLAEVATVLEESKPKDWWTMPTPARKSKRQSIANRAARGDDLLAQMEKQLGMAQDVLKTSVENTMDTNVFSSDEEEDEEEEEEEEEVAARWTLASLPIKKADTVAKMEKFAKTHSKEIGTVPKSTKKTKAAFFTALTDLLREKGLLA